MAVMYKLLAETGKSGTKELTQLHFNQRQLRDYFEFEHKMSSGVEPLGSQYFLSVKGNGRDGFDILGF